MPSQLPAGTNLGSPQIKLLSNLTGGFAEMNVEIIGKQLHKDFRRSVYPRSLGQPELGKEDYLKEASGILGFATGFNVGYIPCYLNLISPGYICSAADLPFRHRSTWEGRSPRPYSSPFWSIPAST